MLLVPQNGKCSIFGHKNISEGEKKIKQSTTTSSWVSFYESEEVFSLLCLGEEGQPLGCTWSGDKRGRSLGIARVRWEGTGQGRPGREGAGPWKLQLGLCMARETALR